MSEASNELRFQRVYPARRDLVFRALTEPELISRWFFPSADVTMRVDAFDLRVGEAYRFIYSFTDGAISRVTGKFLEIEPPSLLAFTWTWEPPDPHAGVETIVTFRLVDLNDSTELTVEHKRLPEAYRRIFTEGWPQTLLHLHHALSKRTRDDAR